MAETTNTNELIDRLAASPARFVALLSSLEDADSVAVASEGQWSPAEVMSHVRAANDILEPRLYQVLVRDSTPLIGFDERRWLEVAGYASLPITDLLHTMILKRKELVHALRGLSPEDWQRTGTHEVRGPISVLDIATQIADHEDEHLAQIAAAIGR
ncbi:MAG: DinB family protein [Chloroflexia bacterium]